MKRMKPECCYKQHDAKPHMLTEVGAAGKFLLIPVNIGEPLILYERPLFTGLSYSLDPSTWLTCITMFLLYIVDVTRHRMIVAFSAD